MTYLIIAIAIIILILIAVFLLKNDDEPEFVLTEEFKQILDILQNTNESIFITGKAGTGKSTLLRYFINNTNKKFVILAPTGIAALNVGGQTIHSFFRFSWNLDVKNLKPDYVRASLFQKLDMIIIDEISMVRADLMDCVDKALRINRNVDKPFGDLQMAFIGDLFQLPPVLKENEVETITRRFQGEYFFNAPVFKNFKFSFKELTIIFRQNESQAQFKNLLNNIRNNKVTFDDLVLLNSRHKNNAGEQEDSVFLTTRKNIARRINKEKLQNLSGNYSIYNGILTGQLEKLKEQNEEDIDDDLPAPYKLALKLHSQVMMLKNDQGKRWVNGSVGRIAKLGNDEIWVEIENKSHLVEQETWKEVEYFLNKEKDQIEEKDLGEFIQYPLQPAYAITIHKSQGKTFEKITVDIGTGAFAHGQVYVGPAQT